MDSPKFAGKRVVVGSGMLLHLNSVLFAQHPVDLDKELADNILKIYFESQPSILSKVNKFFVKLECQDLNSYEIPEPAKILYLTWNIVWFIEGIVGIKLGQVF